MGNCVTSSNKIEPPPSEAAVIKPRPTKKMVRFKLHKECNVDRERLGESKGEVVRIRVVVTKEELKQILSYKKDFNCSSVEQLVSAIKLRGRMISDAETSERGVNGAWRPELESIPEDH